MTNDIAINLERSVPYNIELEPSSPGFEFYPSKITFYSYMLPVQYFKIKPLDGAKLG